MMNRTMLSEMKTGEYAIVKNVGNNGDIRRRFMDLGLTRGSSVRCVIAGKRGIKAYYIKGAVIAIRQRDSRYIEVENHGKE